MTEWPAPEGHRLTPPRRTRGKGVLPCVPGRRAAEEVHLYRYPKAADSRDPRVVVDRVPMTAAARRGPLVRHPVAAFVGLAYLMSWLCWLPLLVSRQGWVTWSVSPYLHLAGGLGPATAAVVVTASVSGRAGVAALLRRCLAWRGRLRWVALAVLGPLGLFGVSVVAARLVDGGWPALDRFGSSTEYAALPLVVFWAANVLFYGFGEEIGWRGFLQPSLQRGRSAFSAALLVAVVWAAWHVPLFGITPTYRAMPRAGFVGFFLSLLVAALLLAWLYLVSDGSILVVAIFHAVFDIATTTPTATTSIPTLMGVAVTIAGLATIPHLIRVPPTDAARR